MPWTNYVALAFIAIFIFLILNNAAASVKVLNALGGQATLLTGALQGRGVSGNGISLTAPAANQAASFNA